MTTDERAIVHMDLDTFFVSCERLMDHRLIGKPVLIGGTSDRGVVASCSYEARRFGIHSAMPMRMAKNLCHEAIVFKRKYWHLYQIFQSGYRSHKRHRAAVRKKFCR